MLQIKNLTKVYRSKKGSDVVAIDGISAEFGSNGLLFLSGKSGCGKTTLLNLLGGIDTATSGEVIVDGRSFKTFSVGDYDSYRNTYIGFVFQEYNLIESYSVGENVAIALELQGRKADRAAIDVVLRRVELVDGEGATLFDRRVNELSGGQKQRVAIARALIKNPQVILADEPTGALDSETGIQLYELLKNLSKEKLIIVVSHDTENAKKYGDRIIELKDGRIVDDTGAGQEAGEREKRSLIKSRLPFFRSFKIGAGALKHKKFRLALSVLLSFVSFFVFGFSFAASRANSFIAEIKTLYENDMRMAIIEGDSHYSRGGDYESRISDLIDKQPEEIEKYAENSPPLKLAYAAGSTNHTAPSSIFSDTELFHYGRDIEMMEAEKVIDNYANIGLRPSPCVEIDPQTGETDANIRPDSRFVNKSLCRLPNSFDEIAISDLKADMFMRYGHRANDGTVTEINSPDDLIGKTFGDFTICGVYSTEIDLNFLKEHGGPFANNDYYSSTYFYGCSDSIITYSYVLSGFADHIDTEKPQEHGSARMHGRLMLKLSGNLSKDKALYKALTYKTDTHNLSVRLVSPFSGFRSDATLFEEYLLLPSAIAAGIFLVFSSLLTMNFLTVSLDFKKKELGILRALGARGKDIVRICLVESLLIACMNFVLSLSAILILSGVLNKLFRLSLIIVGPLEVAVLFLLVFAVSALSSVLPVRRLAKKRPVDVINKK